MKDIEPETVSAEEDGGIETPLEPLPSNTKRRKKPTEEMSSISELLSSKGAGGKFDRSECAFFWAHLKQDWGNLTKGQRATVLRELVKYETDEKEISESTIKFICEKSGFLTDIQVAGYLEIIANAHTLKTLANLDVLDDEAITIIGTIRLQYKICLNPNYQTQLRKLSALRPVKPARTIDNKILNDILAEISGTAELAFKPGDKCRINPGSKQSKNYSGIAEYELEYVDQNNPEITSDNRKTKRIPDHKFFRCRGRIMAIDQRAVMKIGDVKKDEDEE